MNSNLKEYNCKVKPNFDKLCKSTKILENLPPRNLSDDFFKQFFEKINKGIREIKSEFPVYDINDPKINFLDNLSCCLNEKQPNTLLDFSKLIRDSNPLEDYIYGKKHATITLNPTENIALFGKTYEKILKLIRLSLNDVGICDPWYSQEIDELDPSDEQLEQIRKMKEEFFKKWKKYKN